MSFERLEKVVGYAGFAAMVAAYSFFGIITSIRVAGICLIVSGVLSVTKRAIPVGWEGQPPSFFMTGSVAVVAGVLIASLGATLVMFPSQVACFFWWKDLPFCH